MAREIIEFKGGSAFKKKLAEIAAKLGEGKSLSVGFLEGATYPAEVDGDTLHVAQVAFWSEFGSKRTPPRPFFRGMIAKQSSKWGNALGKIAVATNYDGEQTLALMGEGIKGQLQQSINEFTSPPLAQSTIDRKGFAKPLIDTAHMLRSVDFQVDDGLDDGA